MKIKLLKALKRITGENSYEVKLCKTILAYLEMAYLFYQSAHWQTNGSEFYADHLLFQRLYEGLRDEIDGLGEKIVGVYSLDFVNFTDRLKNICTLSDFVGMESLQKSYISTALLIENKLLEQLASADLADFSPGVKDLFAGFANTHEGHVYLLKQRQQ